MPIKSLSRSSILTFEKYSSMLAGNSAYSPGSFDLLETEILLSPQASVTFSDLITKYATEYQNLQIRMTARASRSGATTDPLIVKLNGATQTYAHHLYGNGSTAGSGYVATAYSVLDAITAPGAVAGLFGSCVIDILDPFKTAKNKTIKAFSGANNVVALSSAFWNLTNPTSSITLSAYSATDFLIGSRFSLYGFKAGA